MAVQPASERGAQKIDRGQRIADEVRITHSHDGKEKASFVRPAKGELPADVHGGGERAAPPTTEDVVESPDTSSVWEAKEQEGD
jgi:hypothetical protein